MRVQAVAFVALVAVTLISEASVARGACETGAWWLLELCERVFVCFFGRVDGVVWWGVVACPVHLCQD